MMTCYVRYILDPYQLDAFEQYARFWIARVKQVGGTHHGYYLPSEGANNIALTLFSFESFAAYEQYRQANAADPACKAMLDHAKQGRYIISFERSFMRPLFE